MAQTMKAAINNVVATFFMRVRCGLTDNGRPILQPILFRGFDFAPGENVCPEKVTRGIGTQPRLANGKGCDQAGSCILNLSCPLVSVCG